MTKRQTPQHLADTSGRGLRDGDADAGLDQKLVSAQNWVVSQRAGYEKSLANRAEVIGLAHAAGWSVYRIAKRLGITRKAVDEALARPKPRTPLQFLSLEIKRNGGLENPTDRSIRALILARPGER